MGERLDFGSDAEVAGAMTGADILNKLLSGGRTGLPRTAGQVVAISLRA